MTTQQFDILATALRPRLRDTAMAITRSRDESSDLVQDTLLRLWMLRDKLEQYRSVEALAVTIVKRLALNALRDVRLTADPDEALGQLTASDEADSAILEAERRSQVDAILGSLSPRLRTIIIMKHIDELENSHIASLLGISDSSVRSALCRARSEIQKHFLNN